MQKVRENLADVSSDSTIFRWLNTLFPVPEILQPILPSSSGALSVKITRVLYEVNIDIEPTIQTVYEIWLKSHVEEVTHLGKFQSALIYHRKGESDRFSVGYTVHYVAESQQILDTYFQNAAPRLRAEAEKLFGSKFKISRRILTQKKD